MSAAASHAMPASAIALETLGRTGVPVSRLCLGTMMFGSNGNPDHAECVRIMHAALDAGINFVDTADVYGPHGETERIVGQAVAGSRREQVVLATKGHFPMEASALMRGNSRSWIRQAVEGSLRRLGTDWIDLYQLHRPDPTCDIDEALGALSDLVREGKIRMIGTSTFPAWQIVEAQWTSERRHRERFVTEQAQYSIFTRGHRGESPSSLPAVRAGHAGLESAGRRLACWGSTPKPAEISDFQKISRQNGFQINRGPLVAECVVPKEMDVLPRRRRNSPEQVHRLFVARCQIAAQQPRQQHGIEGNHHIGNQPAAVVADIHIQIGASGQFLLAVDLGDGGAQLVVGLNAVFRAVDITLQLRVAQVAQRVDSANQLVILEEGLARAVVP
jgi:hypothetical protein